MVSIFSPLQGAAFRPPRTGSDAAQFDPRGSAATGRCDELTIVYVLAPPAVDARRCSISTIVVSKLTKSSLNQVCPRRWRSPL
jgi:hypothetical protein